MRSPSTAPIQTPKPSANSARRSVVATNEHPLFTPQPRTTLPRAEMLAALQSIREITASYGIRLNRKSEIVMDLKGEAPQSFLSRALPLCRAVFGPAFSCPTMYKEWRDGEIYEDKFAGRPAVISFPVRSEDAPSGPRYGVWANSTRELELVYAVASLLGAKGALTRRLAYEPWLTSLSTTDGMQRLRAQELEERPEWIRREVALRDPFVASVDAAIHDGATTLTAIQESRPGATFKQIHAALSNLSISRETLRSTLLNELLSQGALN